VLLLDIASEAIVDILALPLQRLYFGLQAIISGFLPLPQAPVLFASFAVAMFLFPSAVDESDGWAGRRRWPWPDRCSQSGDRRQAEKHQDD
jgi:hypothetical protein